MKKNGTKKSKNQSEKSKFRSSDEWRTFRIQFIQERNGLCDFCGIDHMKATRKLELHHKDLNPDNYTNLSNPLNFALLCGNCHKSIHQFHTRVISKKHPTKNIQIIQISNQFFI